MKRNTITVIILIFCLYAFSVHAQEKVVVIPLGSSSSNQYYTLPGVTFVGDKSATRNLDGSISLPVLSYFYAPVILPNLAKVTEFVVYAKNGSTSIDSEVSLRRFDRASASPEVMATATIPYDTGTYQALIAPSITHDVIDNIDYSYAVVVDAREIVSINAIRITYISN